MMAATDIHGRALTTLRQLTLGQKPPRVEIDAAYEHMAACDACWERFDRLTESLTGEKLEALGEIAESWLPAAPTFGEQWLLDHRAPEVARQPGRWRRGWGYLARLAEGVEQQAAALLVSFQSLFSGPSPAFAHRSGVPHEGLDLSLIRDSYEPLEIVLPCNELPDLQTTVVLKSDALRPDWVRAMVMVSIPARWPDFSGVRVILDDGMQQLERTTGRSGYLEFEPIPRGRIPSLNFIVQLPRITM